MIAFLLIFLALLLFFPEIAITGSKYGVTLWVTQLIPTLLPFFILIRLLCHSLPRFSSSRPFLLLGLLCGYPAGASLVATQYNRGLLSRRKAYFYLGFVNNPSPMFVIVFCGHTILHLSTIQAFGLFCLVILSSFLGSIIFYGLSSQFVPDTTENTKKAVSSETCRIFNIQLVDQVIMESFIILLRIGGYVTLFSILGQCVSALLPTGNWVTAPLTGCLEITCGTSYLAATPISYETKKVLMMSILSFGGLSAAAQTGSVLSSTDLSLFYYVIMKLLNCFVAACLTAYLL